MASTRTRKHTEAAHRAPLGGGRVAAGLLALLVTAGVGLAGPLEGAAAANLITNGSFEEPDIPTGSFVIFANPGVPGWTHEPAPQAVSSSGLEIQDHLGGGGAPDPTAGAQFAELDSDGPSNIYQDVATNPGSSYRLTFLYSARLNTASAQNHFRVTAGPETAEIGPLPSTSVNVWVQRTLDFVATQTTSRIAFLDLGPEEAGGLGALIDLVSVDFVASVVPPDLALTKSCTPSSPGTFNCTLIVTNNGPGAAASVVVTDDLSPGFTAGPVTKSDPSFTCTDPPGTVDIRCTSPSLAEGSTAIFTYTVSIGETAAPGQSFTNIAAVSSSNPDPVPGNNQAHATIKVPGCQKTGTTVNGTPGNDVLCGTAGNDMIIGLGGNDLIFLFGGNDSGTGGDGNDIILGGPGADKLTGGNGNDRLFGNDGNDSMTGGAGTDLGSGGAGTDTCTSTESGVC